MSEQNGSFGIQGTGDTSGYGGLVRSSFSPTSAQKPYGSYFDEVTDSRATLDLAAGEHELVVALDLCGGKGWGIYFHLECPEGSTEGELPTILP